jgi:Rieske Fe-S protein
MTLHDRPFTRRTVVAGAGVAAAAAAVGCSSPESDVKKSAAAPPPVVHREPPAPILGDGVPNPEGEPIAACNDIPVGSGIVKDGTIITQPLEDEFYGFSSVCTHSGCQITQIIKDKIKCTCHGSEFSLFGDPEKGPARKQLSRCKIVMANETIFKQP